MTEVVKFRPEEINEAIEGLDGLRDIIAPVLRRINGDGMGEQDAQQFIRQLTMAKHALIAMGGFLEAEMKMVQASSNDPLDEEQLREMDGEPVYLDLGDDSEWVLVRLNGYDVWFTHKNTICVPAKLAFDLGVEAYRYKPTVRPAKGGPACDAEGLHEGRTDLRD